MIDSGRRTVLASGAAAAAASAVPQVFAFLKRHQAA